jgi:hypothetical protein
MPRAGNPHWSGWHWRGRALRPGPSDFFSLLKTTHTGRKTYRTRDEERADVFDYIECFDEAFRRAAEVGSNFLDGKRSQSFF